MGDPQRPQGPLLTLEPFLDAVREGLEEAGWELSGLQKTTSFEFEGRWAGDSSRSAYLFFHRPDVPDWASVDAFLDETSRGLKGNLALVLDGPVLTEIPDPASAMATRGASRRRDSRSAVARPHCSGARSAVSSTKALITVSMEPRPTATIKTGRPL